MVYLGKPSRGCSNCRKLHVKCDEKRPECSRCSRMKRDCTGYRDDIDLIFRHENASCKRYSRARKQCNSGLASHETVSLLRLGYRGRSSLLEISQSVEDVALCFFYNSTLENLPESDHSRYLHKQLPSLLQRSASNSALRLATLAISYAVTAKSKPNTGSTFHSSRRLYVDALSAVSAAIRENHEVKNDETMYAVLMLAGYETTMFSSDTVNAWGSHVDGAITLLKLRGKEPPQSLVGRLMFKFILRNAVLSHMQTSKPIDPILIRLANFEYSDDNIEDQLISKTIQVPNLQYFSNGVFIELSYNYNDCGLQELITIAMKLDYDLCGWATNIPSNWRFRKLQDIRSSYGAKWKNSAFVCDHVHTYQDLYVARVWNLYRTSRIIVLSITLRANEQLKGNSTTSYPFDSDLNIKAMLQDLVDDICASVPYVLGFNSGLRRSTESPEIVNGNLWPQNSMTLDSAVFTKGSLSILWPLYVASSCSFIPKLQRDWMLAQLSWLGQSGHLPQARMVVEHMNQAVIGEAERFRFDCV